MPPVAAPRGDGFSYAPGYQYLPEDYQDQLDREFENEVEVATPSTLLLPSSAMQRAGSAPLGVVINYLLFRRSSVSITAVPWAALAV